MNNKEKNDARNNLKGMLAKTVSNIKTTRAEIEVETITKDVGMSVLMRLHTTAQEIKKQIKELSKK